MLNLDTTRPLFSQAKPLLDTLSSAKPILLLPFNIWLYFITMPFRVLFFVTGLFNKKTVKEAKEKVMEIKEEVIQRLPEQLKPEAPIERRPLRESVGDDARPFGWYQVDKEATKSERSMKSEEKAAEPAKKVDPIAELKEKLAESESHERASVIENKRLQKELSEFKMKYDSEEKALKIHEKEDARLKTLISVEQRKCFDLQSESVRLRMTIKKLEESAAKLAAEKPAEKIAETPAEKPVEQLKLKSKIGAKKSKNSKKTQAAKPAEEPEAVLEKEDPINHPHGWHAATQSHFTEMVAQAQQEELEHGKSFVDTLKEAIKPAEVAAPAKEEFLVVGGDSSMKHITLPVATKPVEKPVEKTVASIEKEDPINHPHGWHATPQTHFTEMVAEAQKEELEHGKTFADTLKEAIKPVEVAAPTKEEFLVVGGDNSMHHITMPLSAN